MMQSRYVETLHLHAPHADAVRRGQNLVADGLHTATLPDAGGALLLIRKVNLGTFHLTRSSAAVALRFEAAVRDLRVRAVPAAHPAASRSMAVYFSDEIAPYVELAIRLSRGQTTDEWFWPLAVPGWRPFQRGPAGVRQVLVAALEGPLGKLAVVRVVLALAEPELLPTLIAAIPEADGLALLHAFQWQPVPIMNVPVSDRGVLPIDIPVRARGALVGAIENWGVADYRTLWFAGVLQLGSRLSRVMVPDVMPRAAQWIAAVSDQQPDARIHDNPVEEDTTRQIVPSSTLSPNIHDDTAVQMGNSDRMSLRSGNVSPDQVDTTSTEISPKTKETLKFDSGSGEMMAAEDIVVKPDSPALEKTVPWLPILRDYPWLAYAEATDYGGLVFLLNVMNQLGVFAFMQAEPGWIECDLAARILLTIAERVEVPEDDAVRGVFQRLTGTLPETLPQYGVIPASWSQFGPLPRDLRTGEYLAMTLTDAISVWTWAIEQWCSQVAELDLSTVVKRPALVALTATHLDVTFDLEQAEVAIRRVGLDFNPGWVPWLGRVVTIHYLENI